MVSHDVSRMRWEAEGGEICGAGGGMVGAADVRLLDSAFEERERDELSDVVQESRGDGAIRATL
jgi:hypothetical protein